MIIALLSVYILGFLINMAYAYFDYRYEKGFIEQMLITAFLSIVPGISQILTFVALYNTYESKQDSLEEYNTIHECPSCGVYSRKGYVEVYKIQHGVEGCPQCGEVNDLKIVKLNINTELPFSPKFTSKKIKEIEKLKVEKGKNELLDSQLEKYLALQQKKVNESYTDAIDRLEQIK